ncbi:hypothetical protein Tsubulata_009542 [Turnera subulata]|uniref:DUF4283 domain-containing protein n=1 Tax=Turnera subulata TaxID=218843 RepID=A0A9Q0FJ28_9ROSI|nr:hypothetical protein Tsubulata_009542 [Turnera subulata]
MFQFEEEADKSSVALGVPWFFSNCHIVIKEWLPHLSWEQVELGKSCIWVQVHGLQLELMNEDNATAIGNSIGGLLETDISVDRILNPQSFF